MPVGAAGQKDCVQEDASRIHDNQPSETPDSQYTHAFYKRQASWLYSSELQSRNDSSALRSAGWPYALVMTLHREAPWRCRSSVQSPSILVERESAGVGLVVVLFS